MLIYPLSKFGGTLGTNSLWALVFYSFRFKWKNWFENTALNISIERVIFTSGQNLNRHFSANIWSFSMISFYIREFIWIITLTEKWKFEENCRCNLNCQNLVHWTERNRNLQDVLVWKSNLVLSKSKNCWRQCYQGGSPSLGACNYRHIPVAIFSLKLSPTQILQGTTVINCNH